VWTWELLRSSWAEVGLGERNSAISVNPLAWLKVALPIVLSGRVSQIVYLCGSLVVAGLGTYRLTRENLAVPVRFAWTCVPLLLASPFVFDKIASGQSSYWAGFAAFVWGLSLALDAFETNARGTLLASAACFALASVQLQFLAFAWLAYAVRAAVARRGSAVGAAVLGCAASTTLALPSLWFLASRGALAGAAISPPYRSWLAALSATPADAAATLGYVGRYAERAVADTPAVLGVTHVAAFALIGAALFAAATVRSANTGTLAILGALGWWWLTGVDGPFGSLRELLFLNVADAGFFREYYHAGALYAVALVALGTLGISRLPGVLGPLRLPLALGAVVAFGPQTWSGGLGRILAFAAAPRTTGALAAAAGNEEARVLFLPAQQPLRTKGDAVGGNDGLDWIDARHHSAYEYYLPPLVATIAQAVARGDARTARRLLFRIDASAVVFRTFLRSGEGGERDRSLATLTAAFGPPAQAGPGTLLFAVPHAPMLDAPDRLAPQPADLGAMADAPRLAYADVPGTDVQPFAVDLDRSSPDPRAGWIARRDAPVVDAARIAADAYGVITLREGAAVTFRDLPGGNLLGWDPAHGLMRRSVPAGDLRIVAPGPEAVIEAGEMPFPPRPCGCAAEAPWCCANGSTSSGASKGRPASRSSGISAPMASPTRGSFRGTAPSTSGCRTGASRLRMRCSPHPSPSSR
jgi:hypothetical protein